MQLKASFLNYSSLPASLTADSTFQCFNKLANNTKAVISVSEGVFSNCQVLEGTCKLRLHMWGLNPTDSSLEF